MSRLNTSQQQNIARIITECDELTRHPSRAETIVLRTLSLKLTRHSSLDSQQSHWMRQEKGREGREGRGGKQQEGKEGRKEGRKERLLFFKSGEGGVGRSATQLTDRRLSPPNTQYKPRKLKPQFCGEVNLSRRSRAVFFQIVDKFKKTYYPTNASRGESDTSEMKQKTPREVTLYRNQPHAEQHASELRNLAILSRVITENTRKEAKLLRERCGKSHVL